MKQFLKVAVLMYSIFFALRFTISSAIPKNKPIVYPIGTEEVNTFEDGVELVFRYSIDGKDSVVFLKDYRQLEDYMQYLKSTCVFYENRMGN